MVLVVVVLIGGNMRSFFGGVRLLLQPRMLPLGIPLFTMFFSSLYVLVVPTSAHDRPFWTDSPIETALHIALAVSFLCLIYAFVSIFVRKKSFLPW